MLFVHVGASNWEAVSHGLDSDTRLSGGFPARFATHPCGQHRDLPDLAGVDLHEIATEDGEVGQVARPQPTLDVVLPGRGGGS